MILTDPLFADTLLDLFLNDLAVLPNLNLYTLLTALLKALFAFFAFLTALLTLPPAFATLATFFKAFLN